MLKFTRGDLLTAHADEMYGVFIDGLLRLVPQTILSNQR